LELYGVRRPPLRNDEVRRLRRARVVKVKVKKGTPFIEGKVASQVANEGFGTYATGGGNQLYFLQEYFDDIQVIEKFVNPIK